jgi:DNA-binding NtrC family response regulator
MTGHEMFCQIRQAQPRARVILMTAFGYDPTHSIVKCRQEGLRHILYKPFRVDQLLDALENNEAPPSTPPGAPPAAPAAVNA